VSLTAGEGSQIDLNFCLAISGNKSLRELWLEQWVISKVSCAVLLCFRFVLSFA
jgi:hypothetical protein